MTIFRSPFLLALSFLSLCMLEFPLLASAQQGDRNGVPFESEEQATGCQRLVALPPLPSAKVVSCQNSDSVEVSMPLNSDESGLSREKRVRGPYQFREYEIGKLEQPVAFDNLLQTLTLSGFTVKYSNKPSTITARNGNTWILINVGEETYDVNVVQEPPDVWTTVKTVEEISREIQAHGRVDIYGIEFSPTDQSIVEEKSQILSEILQYLKDNPNVSIVIESDKVSPPGAPDNDAEITRERANAVMDWLIAHGIEKSRLEPWPAGRNNPVTENEDPSGIARNERIVLKKRMLAGTADK